MPDGGVPLVLARAVFVASLLSLGGTLAFGVLVAQPALVRASPADIASIGRMLRRLTWLSLAAAAASLLAWTILQTAEIAGTAGPRQAFAALRPVLAGTSFGHLALLQLVLLGLTAGVLRMAPSPGLRLDASRLIAAAANVSAQAGHGHVMAMDGSFSLLFGVDVLHLLAAAAWMGGLLPLLLVVRLSAPATGAMAARWFSPMGRLCVAVLAGTALVQGWVLVGTLKALTGSPYGWVVLVKTVLFLLLTGLALRNRYRLAPALRGSGAQTARSRLVSSILLQTALGLAAVVAASWLSGLTPGMDMGQPAA